MKNKDREKLMFGFRILAVLLAIAMVLGIVFGSGFDFF